MDGLGMYYFNVQSFIIPKKATTTFLIISYLVNPSLRSFPRGLIIFTAIAANILVNNLNIFCAID